MTPTPPRVLVVGDVIDDVVVRPLGPVRHGSDTPSAIEPAPGGSAANQAAWLADQGASVTFVGRVGADDVERHHRALSRLGVTPLLAGDPGRPTGRIVVLVDRDGERSMFTDRGANLGLAPADLPERLLDDVDHLHLSGYSLVDDGVRATVLPLIARARSLGIPWSIDPASVAFLADVGAASFLQWVSGCSLLLPNLDEGRLLGGAAEPDEIVDTLLRHVPVVALKLGPDGAVVADHRERVRVPAAAAEVVDTTGAGDAFSAGFLAHWLGGRSLAASAAAATAAAARCVGAPGGRPRGVATGPSAGAIGPSGGSRAHDRPAD